MSTGRATNSAAAGHCRRRISACDAVLVVDAIVLDVGSSRQLGVPAVVVVERRGSRRRRRWSPSVVVAVGRRCSLSRSCSSDVVARCWSSCAAGTADNQSTVMFDAIDVRGLLEADTTVCGVEADELTTVATGSNSV